MQVKTCLKKAFMNIEEEINLIRCRNRKAEADKAWEISNMRKIAVALTAYFVMICVMYVLKMENPFIGAIIPTLGFILSTVSDDLVKKIRMKKFYKNGETCHGR